jgi:cell division protein FtsX
MAYASGGGTFVKQVRVQTFCAMLAVCALLCCFMTSCTKLFKQAESYLECDQEIEMKFKVDIKDKEEQRLEKLEASKATG